MAQTLGEIIKRRRMEQGWTQTKLARRLDLSKSTVNGWEKGTRRPLITNVEPLSKELKIRRSMVIDLLLMERNTETACPGQSTP